MMYISSMTEVISTPPTPPPHPIHTPGRLVQTFMKETSVRCGICQDWATIDWAKPNLGKPSMG